MNLSNFTKPILLRKMEQLYHIEFDNTAYICSVFEEKPSNEYCLVSAETVRKTALDEIQLNEIKFDSIIEVLYQTSTGKYSENNQINLSGFYFNLSLVLCFRYNSKLCYIDIQNQLYREMIDFSEASILADADLKNWLDQHSNFNDHILFLSEQR